jgi:DNA-binding transcriptional LysR family regulator
MRANNGHTARAAALAGVGVIWQPSFVVGHDVQAGRLVEVMPGYRMPPIDILAIYASRRHLSAKVRVMVDFLVNAFQDSPREDGELAAVGS